MGGPLTLDYQASAYTVKNDGHVILVDVEAGSRMEVSKNAFDMIGQEVHGGASLLNDTVTYELKSIQFHSPSEHLLNDEKAPMEMQLIHANAQGRFAVVSVFLMEGAENGVLNKFWLQLPNSKTQVGYPKKKLDARLLLPESIRNH